MLLMIQQRKSSMKLGMPWCVEMPHLNRRTLSKTPSVGLFTKAGNTLIYTTVTYQGYQRTFENVLRIANLGEYLKLSRNLMHKAVLYPRYQRNIVPSLKIIIFIRPRRLGRMQNYTSLIYPSCQTNDEPSLRIAILGGYLRLSQVAHS